MFKLIIENLGTILVAAALLAIILSITASMLKKKKQGKCVSCDCCDKACHFSVK